MTQEPRFVLMDRVEGTITSVDAASLRAVLITAVSQAPEAIGLCGHAGFRVPDLRYLLPILRPVVEQTGSAIRLVSTLADARHSSDDGGCSPLRVHVEMPQRSGSVATSKNRVRLAREDDPYVSQIPFGPPKHHDPSGLNHRAILDAFRRVVQGGVYRWVSTRVMVAADRTLRDEGATLLDFHRHLRDVVLEEQLEESSGVVLTPTVATAFPAGHQEHIIATHQHQAAVAIDLLRSENHAREVIGFFRSAHAHETTARLPRWQFAPVEPGCYFCRGVEPRRDLHPSKTIVAGTA